MQRTIRIENVGPIGRLTFPLPDAGVVVLRGRNGTGKSHALQAVDTLVSGRGHPPCRDFAARGLVEGFGARLTIGRSQRRTGEAEVVTLEGRLDISQLVQPPIKDEEAADRTRIKALVQLAGTQIEPDAFDPILPAGLSASSLVGLSEQTDDPVVMAGRLKRALEAEARRLEREAETLRAQAVGLAAGVAPESPDGPTRDQAEADLREALLAERELVARAEEAKRQQQRIETARAQIQKLSSELPEDQTVARLESEETQLTDQIEKLRRALAVATERRDQVRRQLHAARLVASQLAELQKVLSAKVEDVPETLVVAARERIAAAKATLERAIQREQDSRRAAEAAERHKLADANEAKAKSLREAASATDGVLSDLVGRVTSRLRVNGGRLVCDTDRGVELFAELSPGERWRIALEIAAEQVGTGGLVTVPQEAWEALDPVHRHEVAGIAKRLGVVVLTAEATDDEQIAVQSL